MKIRILLLAAFASVLAACTQPTAPQPEATKPYIPYASMTELDSLPRSATLTTWRAARFLLFLEFEQAYKPQFNWPAAYSLSERPVVIYGEDSNPKFYEFYVLNESGTEVATITSPARKSETPTPAAYTFTWIRDYGKAKASSKQRGLLNVEAQPQIFASGYPGQVSYGRAVRGAKAKVYNSETGEESTAGEASSSADAMANYIKSFTTEELAAMGNTDPAIFATLDTKVAEEKKKQATFDLITSTLDEIEAAIATKSDAEIREAMEQEKKANSKEFEFYTRTNYYELPAYQGAIRNTTWSGWCGPSALAWVYRGLRSSYKGHYIKLGHEAGEFNRQIAHYPNNAQSPTWFTWCFRDIPGKYQFFLNSEVYTYGSSKMNKLDKSWVDRQSQEGDYGLYAALANDLGVFAPPPFDIPKFAGMSYPQNFGSAMSNASDRTYSITFCYQTDVANAWIKNVRLPLIELRLFNGIEPEPHYVAAIGSKEEQYRFRIYFWYWWFGFHTQTIYDVAYWTNIYFLQYDNGYLTKANNYNPFWEYQPIYGMYYPIYRLP